jgi:hypothetical protein
MLKPWIGTLFGLLLGILAVGVWLLTFAPHGGVELSSWLFPLSVPVLNLLYPEQSIPVPVWFTGIALHWPLIGLVIDLVRRRNRISSAGSKQP